VATKEKRIAKAKMLLNRLKVPAAKGQLFFFSNEKNFSQDQKINIYINNRCLCSDISEVPRVITTKFLATVILLAVVSNKADMILSNFFTRGLKINAEEYVKVLRGMVKPLMGGLRDLWAPLRFLAGWFCPQCQDDL
jgi:hypothetical protein